MFFALLRKKPGALNYFLERLDIHFCEMRRRWVAFEQVFADDIDTSVGALGRKNRRDQQLKSVLCGRGHIRRPDNPRFSLRTTLAACRFASADATIGGSLATV